MLTTMINYKTKSRLVELKSTKMDFNQVKITTSKDAYLYAMNFFNDDIDLYESFFIIMLNRANTTIAYAKISQGGCVGTVVDSKIIAKYAIDSLANSVILCHNHPSCNKNASQADIDITKKIKSALQLLDVTTLDHVIVTSESYYSMADEGIL
jgi:DNA repair protein RadC